MPKEWTKKCAQRVDQKVRPKSRPKSAPKEWTQKCAQRVDPKVRQWTQTCAQRVDPNVRPESGPKRAPNEWTQTCAQRVDPKWFGRVDPKWFQQVAQKARPKLWTQIGGRSYSLHKNFGSTVLGPLLSVLAGPAPWTQKFGLGFETAGTQPLAASQEPSMRSLLWGLVQPRHSWLLGCPPGCWSGAPGCWFGEAGRWRHKVWLGAALALQVWLGVALVMPGLAKSNPDDTRFGWEQPW